MTQNGVQVLERALRLLEHLVQVQPVGVNELARGVGLPTTTVHRILTSLLKGGLVEQLPDSDKYQVGIRLFEWGQAPIRRLQLAEVAKPFLVQLSAEFGNSAVLGIRNGGDIVYVDWIPAQHIVQPAIRLGARVPLHTSVLGIALLAWLPEAERQELHVRHLESVLEQVRQRGYATDDGERHRGFRAVAAPVFGRDGMVVGSVAVGGPATMFPPERLEFGGLRLIEVAAVISNRLGYEKNVYADQYSANRR